MAKRKTVEQVMHEAHLAYQRERLKADAVDIPCPEQRGCRYVNKKPVVFNPAWFTHLRDNFWRAFVETTMEVQRAIAHKRQK